MNMFFCIDLVEIYIQFLNKYQVNMLVVPGSSSLVKSKWMFSIKNNNNFLSNVI